jgi:hypothetical protein
MRDFDKDVVETSLTLNVRYRPKVVCTKTNWVALMNATEVNIHCVVYANPPVDQQNRTWIIRPQTRQVVRLNYPHQSAEYKLLETWINPKVVNATLVINKARRDFFYNSYTLQATNELGTDEKQLSLMLASAPTSGSTLPSPHGSGLRFTVCLLIVTSFQLLRRYGQ